MTSKRSEFRLVADDLGVGWLHVPSGRRLPIVSGGDGDVEDNEDSTFDIPPEIDQLTDEDLDRDNPDSLISKAQAALDLMVENFNDPESADPSPDEVKQAQDLAGAIKDMKAERKARDEAAAQRRAEFEEAVSSVSEDEEAEGDDEGDEDAEGEEESGDAEAEAEGEDAEAEVVAASARRKAPLRVAVTARKPTLNPSLRDIARHQPDPGLDRRPEVVITAGADVPNFANGQRVPTLEDLGKACTERCKALGVGNGTPHFVPLAKIERSFPVTFDADQQTPQQIRTAWEDLISEGLKDGGMEALVAAGGWCAPSEIRYDFFQISEVAGLLDLPTFGVRRGGLRWPQSLSLSDFFALSGAPASGLPTNATMPWEWSEADDIAAATGTSPRKACLRPPCPSFDEQRLGVFGLCVLAGNLTEDAFPEMVRHFLAQTVVAHARVINRRMLLRLEAASTPTTPAVGGESAVNAWLGGLELNAIDYREKHGMRDEAVLEVVAPSWSRGVLRSDLAKKNGIDRLDAADAYLMSLLDVRRLRLQWVQDWQTRGATGIAPLSGSAPTNWPATAKTVMYAPGTFGRGNGMTLDLGVVRDSVLNATNDHTAAWSEEATLLAKFGHESRLITLNTVAGGVTGQQAAMTGP